VLSCVYLHPWFPNTITTQGSEQVRPVDPFRGFEEDFVDREVLCLLRGKDVFERNTLRRVSAWTYSANEGEIDICLNGLSLFTSGIVFRVESSVHDNRPKEVLYSVTFSDT
jgi:hypothetical protein